jgi:vacuolar-type H+-ATPase subunit H
LERDDRFGLFGREEDDLVEEFEPMAPVRRRRERSEELNYRLLSLLEDVEAIIDKGARIPFTTKAIVDRDIYLDAIDAVKIALPESVLQAERIVRDRDRIIAQAEAEAERITSLAREQAAYLISEKQLLKAAEVQSEAILNTARDEAKEIVSSAQKYARDLLMQLEHEAAKILAEIRKASSQVQ